MSKLCYVYLHLKETNDEVFYVGKGTRKYRAYANKGRNVHWNRTVNKYGKKVEIFKSNIEENLAFYLEKFLIKVFGKENLVNMTDGGEGSLGFKWPQSSYEKRKNKTHHMKTEEYRKKLSEAQKGKPRLYAKGENHWSNHKPESVLKGENHPRSKKIICVETKQIFDTVTDAVNWLKTMGYPKAATTNLCKTCNNERKAYGYKWQYVQ